MNLLVTGGSGFIGSNFVRAVINKPQITKLINLDCMTYAADPENLKDIESNPIHSSPRRHQVHERG